MPFPDIINIDDADFTLGGSVNLLLASIAYEEFALARLINAEAGKIQYILGSLEGQAPPDPPATLDEILEVNRSADQTLRDIIKKEILLQIKLEKVLDIPTNTAAPVDSQSSTPTTEDTASAAPTAAATPAPTTEGAWIVGTDYGTGCAQFATMDLGELSKTVELSLSCRRVPVGTVHIVRSGTDLTVTVSVFEPHMMDRVFLYVGNVPPTDSNPENFPYSFTAAHPQDYFKTRTFTIDISDFVNQKIYISVFT